MVSKDSNEIWKPVVGYEGLYIVSNLGNVRSLPRKGTKGGIVVANTSNSKHYSHIPLSKNCKLKTVSLHRVVAEAFIPNPLNKPQVNHIDGNKQNNAVSNLEWVTGEENMQHAFKTGLKNGNHVTKFRSRRVVQMDCFGNVIRVWNSIKEAEAYTGAFGKNICNVCRGQRKTTGGYKWSYFKA